VLLQIASTVHVISEMQGCELNAWNMLPESVNSTAIMITCKQLL